MTTPHRVRIAAGLLLASAVLAGCATLSQVIQPPVFDLAADRTSNVRLLGPSIQRPLGGAEIEVWARVENPNVVGFTLSRLAGTVLLGNQPAAQIDLPLGLPLGASQDTVIPIAVSISFADLPDVANQLRDAFSTGVIDYALRGTVAVDAGPLGQPSFGPETWLQGDVRVTR